MKEDYAQKISRLLRKHSGIYQSLEKKEGRNPHNPDTEWGGFRTKGRKEIRDKKMDKKFKEIIKEFYERFTINNGYFWKDKKNIQTYLLTRVWNY